MYFDVFLMYFVYPALAHVDGLHCHAGHVLGFYVCFLTMYVNKVIE